MARISTEQREKLGQVPPTRTAIRAVREYLAAADMGYTEFAELIGYRPMSLRLWLNDQYDRVAESDLLIRAAAWEFTQENPVRGHRITGRLFETENYRRIRQYFSAAKKGAVCLLYGPPGTQKTFVLEELCAAGAAAQPETAYIYASVSIRPRALLKRIARAARITTSQATNDQLLGSLVRHFRSRAGAVVIDEAQHLNVEALEILRELHDRSGCGLVLAGSHNLFENFLRGRQHLEQWLSRIDHKDPLPGLLEDEVAQIAARELGNGQPAKLSESRVRQIVAACRVDDVFARDEHGKPTVRKYLSVRRLVKFLAQVKAAKEAAA